MVATLYINRQGSESRKQVQYISKSLENAKKSIKRANDHLYNVGSSRVRSERERLTSIYNKDNTYESSFDDFASKLESCVNELIETDEACATKIKRNGQSHRKVNGLPKSLVGAAVNATFTTLGNIVDSAMDDLGKWVDDISSWLKDISKIILGDIDSVIQSIEGFIQAVTSGLIVIPAIFALVTGAAAPFALPIVLAAGVSFIIGLDKASSGVADVMNIYETDGSSVLKHLGYKFMPEWFVDTGYGLIDTATSIFSGAGATKAIEASSIKKVSDKLSITKIDLVEMLNLDIDKVRPLINRGNRYIDIAWTDLISVPKNIKDKGFFATALDLIYEKKGKDLILNTGKLDMKGNNISVDHKKIKK